MSGIIVVGAQWGDEGKGKVIDFLAEDSDIVVRFNGGGNAGHTVFHKGIEIKMHYIPSGVLHGKTCMLGNGMVINPEELINEICFLEKITDVKLLISDKAHVILPYHIAIDLERGKQIGTTGKGIGPAYSYKMMRTNLRIADIVSADAEELVAENIEKLINDLVFSNIIKEVEFEDYKKTISCKYAELGRCISKYVIDTERVINKSLKEGKEVLFEGAQGVMLDIDFGTYPFVTSSNTIAQGAFTGTGASPFYIKRIIGISKAYTTRVGGGPFPTEIKGEQANLIRKVGNEFGATTGRPRRVGFLDLFALKYAVSVSSISEIALTKIDVLSSIDEVLVCTGYNINGMRVEKFPSRELDLNLVEPEYSNFGKLENLSKEEWELLKGRPKSALPHNIRSYIEFIEEYLGIPVKILSYGPLGRRQLYMDELDALSPLDGRYLEKIKELRDIFSEFSLIKKRVYVEVEYLIDFLFTTKQEGYLKEELERIYKDFSYENAMSVKENEKTTKHDVQAVIEYIKKKVPEKLKPLVHFGITSEDVNNVSYGLMLKEARELILKELRSIIIVLIKLADEHRDLIILGRTHAEPATFTTFGKEFSNYAVRLSREYKRIKESEIKGKLTGATGNLNALAALYPDINWIYFSRRFIERIGLSPDISTTQILFSDSYATLFDSLKRLCSILIDINQNIWLYFLIGYLNIQIEEDEIGSSTMPHKINPIGFEGSEGNAKIAEEIFSLLSKNLVKSRLQRDLSDSTIKRNMGIGFGYCLLSLRLAKDALKKIIVNTEKITEDLEKHDEVLSEIIQLYLRKKGEKDAYLLMKEKREDKNFTYKDYFNEISSYDSETLLRYTNGLSSELTKEAIKEALANLE